MPSVVNCMLWKYETMWRNGDFGTEPEWWHSQLCVEDIFGMPDRGWDALILYRNVERPNAHCVGLWLGPAAMNPDSFTANQAVIVEFESGERFFGTSEVPKLNENHRVVRGER
jgi:hypothetical protein